MDKFKMKYALGATPLNSDELAVLIPDYISTQEELNKLERENIVAVKIKNHFEPLDEIQNIGLGWTMIVNQSKKLLETQVK